MRTPYGSGYRVSAHDSSVHGGCRSRCATATAACERERGQSSVLRFCFRVVIFRRVRVLSDDDLCSTGPPLRALLLSPLLLLLPCLGLFRWVSRACLLLLISRDGSPARLLLVARPLLIASASSCPRSAAPPPGCTVCLLIHSSTVARAAASAAAIAAAAIPCWYKFPAAGAAATKPSVERNAATAAPKPSPKLDAATAGCETRFVASHRGQIR